MNSPRIIAFAASLVLLIAANGSATPLYRLVNLGSPAAYTSGTGLNNSGQVVGTSTPVNTTYVYGFVYGNGTTHPLNVGVDTYPQAISDSGEIVGYDTSGGAVGNAFTDIGGVVNFQLPGIGGADTAALAVNARGQFAGWGVANDTREHAAVDSDGVMTDLGFTGAANGINASGQVVGTTSITSNQAFLYSNGVVQYLGALTGKSDSTALAINASGQIVGSAGSMAFLYNDGIITGLGTLGGNSSQSNAINDSGQIVGYARTTSGRNHAFIDSDGVMYDLNNMLDPSGAGWTLTDAVAINNQGWILVDGSSPLANNNNSSAALLIPVPEPPSWSLLAMGAVALVAAAQVSRRRGRPAPAKAIRASRPEASS